MNLEGHPGHRCILSAKRGAFSEKDSLHILLLTSNFFDSCIKIFKDLTVIAIHN